MEIMNYARNEYGVYKVIDSYERDRGSENLCVKLGDIKTGEFVGEAYQNTLIFDEYLPLLIQRDDYVNGSRVLETYRDDVTLGDGNSKTLMDFFIVTEDEYGRNIFSWKKQEIKTWVTAEAFAEHQIEFSEVFSND